MCEEGPGVSRTCDGLLAVNVMSAAAARKCFQAGVRGSHCAGLGAGAAHGPYGWSGNIQAVISFDRQAVFSQGRGGSVLGRAQSDCRGAAPGGSWGGTGAVGARAAFAGLKWQLRRGLPRVIWPLFPKGATRNPTRLATRRGIFVLRGAREPSRAGRGPAGAAGPGLVPHSR